MIPISTSWSSKTPIIDLWRMLQWEYMSWSIIHLCPTKFHQLDLEMNPPKRPLLTTILTWILRCIFRPIPTLDSSPSEPPSRTPWMTTLAKRPWWTRLRTLASLWNATTSCPTKPWHRWWIRDEATRIASKGVRLRAGCSESAQSRA